jgi:polysaccharide export outer membrane protein
MSRIMLLTLAIIVAGFAHADVVSAGQSTGTPKQSSYFIQGAVNKPGVYQIEDPPTILKLIALAGGLSDSHGNSAYIIRRAAPQQPAVSEVQLGYEYRLNQIDIQRLLKGDFQNNTPLMAGDILNIPPSEVFFVTGEANKMSVLPLREGLTLSQAVSNRPVTNRTGQIREVVILRFNPANGKREEIKVNLEDVTSGKTRDPLIKPNDIIVVPASRAGNIIWPFPRILDAPPKQVFGPCRGDRPCVAWSYLESSRSS